MRRRLVVLMAAALAAIPATVLLGGAGPAGAVDVGDETAFRNAWANVAEITLTADITLTCAGGGSADRSSLNDDPVVLDGAGHTVALEVGCLDRVLQQNGDGATTLRNVTVTGGNTTDDGGGYEQNGQGSLTIDRSSFVDNTGCAEGGGIELEQAVPVTVTSSTFSGNRSNQEAAIDLDEGGDLTIVNSTFTGNVTNENGAIGAEGGSDETLALVYSTVVRNVETTETCAATGATPTAASESDETGSAEPQTGAAPAEAGPVEPAASGEPEDAAADGPVALDAGEAANVSLDTSYTLRAFGTVIAEPIGTGSPTPNCVLGGPTTQSSGYNFSDDATCGFTNGATGDRESAGSPGLGALASNGGPTQTMLPATGSPLLDWIPLAACGGGNDLAGFPVTTDQRGVGRPQGPGCDVGAVEVEIVLSFTG